MSSSILQLEVCSPSEFCVIDARGELSAHVRELLLPMEGATLAPDSARVLFPLAAYSAVKAALVKAAHSVSDLPSWIVDVFINARYSKVYPREPKVDERVLAERVPAPLLAQLFPFQRQGVEFAISRNGRCLIADDMGLGN